MSSIPLSVLDLAIVGKGESVRESLQGSVLLAQRAEALGYTRVWYAEHHNIPSIASSATAVLVAHIAANTERIRLGSGGVMLPNHAPLVIAEQFGTLAELHPGRIDLGLGRAPGTDQKTLLALRRDPRSAESFPQDILELQGYLGDETRMPDVNATPGKGTKVPLYILGSSLYGAQLAAVLGLPYGFASHFAPNALKDAVRIYRERFEPSEQLDKPYVIAGVNVIASESEEEAEQQKEKRRRALAKSIFSRGGQQLTDEQVEAVLLSPQAVELERMFTYAAVGTPDKVKAYLEEFREHADADELMTVHQGDSVAFRVRSLELTAEVMGLAPPVPTAP